MTNLVTHLILKMVQKHYLASFCASPDEPDHTQEGKMDG